MYTHFRAPDPSRSFPPSAHDKHSYRQARSLQEHALQFHADGPSSSSAPLLYYYALDFRGEACALHGAILHRQAKFVHRALEAIAARHQASSVDSKSGKMGEGGHGTASILVVGHSYGGVVAKGGVARLLRKEGEKEKAGGKGRRGVRVPALLTLGSPHQRCVVACVCLMWKGWSVGRVSLLGSGGCMCACGATEHTILPHLYIIHTTARPGTWTGAWRRSMPRWRRRTWGTLFGSFQRCIVITVVPLSHT